MDRQALIDTILNKQGKIFGVMGFIMDPWLLPFDEIQAARKPDIAKAKQLIAAAGLEGASMEVEVPGQQQPLALSALQVIQQQLKAVDLNLEIKNLEYAAWQAHLQNLGWAATLSGERAYQDPDGYTYRTYHPDSSQAYSRSHNKELNLLLEKQRVTLVRGERKGILHDIQRSLLNENIGVGVYDAFSFQAVQRDFHVGRTGATGYYWLKDAWFAS